MMLVSVHLGQELLLVNMRWADMNIMCYCNFVAVIAQGRSNRNDPRLPRGPQGTSWGIGCEADIALNLSEEWLVLVLRMLRRPQAASRP